MIATIHLMRGFTLEGVADSWLGVALWVVGLLAGAVILYFTYLGIFQRSERRLTWWLMGLRAAGLLLLVGALLKPTWTRSREQVEPGHVAVVVDNSVSMTLPDASGTPRWERARAAIDQLKKALAEARGERVVVDLFDINGQRLDKLPEQPTVERTDLTRALRKTTLQMRSPSHTLAGLVLVSDGMDNTGRPRFGDWEDTSVPVHGLGFPAGETTEQDVVVSKPQVPARTMIHNEMRVEVPVAKTGKAPAETTVTLKRGSEVLASKKVKLPAGRAEELVALTFTPRQAGNFVLTAAAEPLTGERDLANNAVNFPLRVDAKPIRVLYVEGFLRYEYKYLKARLEDDPDVALKVIVRRGSPDAPEGKVGKEPLTADVLKEFDVVILGDMEGKYLAGSEYQALSRWLDGKEHSLLVLGGYRSFGPDGFRGTPLADALPVVFASAPPYQSEEPFRLELTERGRGHAIFTLSNDRVKDAAAWAEAPPLQGMGLVERAKPGAVVLAVNPRLRQGGKPAVVLAVQRAGGGGQVMVLAADTTWRWSRLPRVLGQSDTLYGRFWSQAIRFLAGRGPDENRPLLTVSTDEPYYGVEKTVKITVRRQPRPDVDLASARLTVEVLAPDGKPLPAERQPTLKANSARPEVFEGEFRPEASGRYQVEASLRNGGTVLTNQTTEFRALGTDLERADPRTNPDNLRALADATGGVYLDVDQADQLPAKLDRKERRSIREVRSEYWNSPWLFGGFLLAVTGEWFLRRRNHLV